MTVVIPQVVSANMEPASTASATVIMVMVARVATCLMRMSANTDLVMSLGIVQILWDLISAPAGKVIPEMDTTARISMSVKILNSQAGVSPMLNAATYQPTSCANASRDLKEMVKWNAEISTNA